MKKMLSFLLPIGVLILSGASAALGFYLRYDSIFLWGPLVGFLLLLFAIVTAGWGTFLFWKKLGKLKITEKEKATMMFLVAPAIIVGSFAFFGFFFFN